MTKKKQQSKKTPKTYRPKFAPRPAKRTVRREAVEEEEGLLRRPETIGTGYRVSTKELPTQYNPLGSSAYSFPPSIVALVLLIILLVLGYLLF